MGGGAPGEDRALGADKVMGQMETIFWLGS